MSLWAELLQIMKEDPIESELLRITHNEESISFMPLDERGFEVAIIDEGEELTVAALSYHEHFEDAEMAYGVAHWLLTPFYRVVEEYAGKKLRKSWIERYTADGWEQIDCFVGYLNTTFGKIKREVSQQKILLPDFKEVVPEAVLDANGLPPDFYFGTRPISKVGYIRDSDG